MARILGMCSILNILPSTMWKSFGMMRSNAILTVQESQMIPCAKSHVTGKTDVCCRQQQWQACPEATTIAYVSMRPDLGAVTNAAGVVCGDALQGGCQRSHSLFLHLGIIAPCCACDPFSATLLPCRGCKQIGSQGRHIFVQNLQTEVGQMMMIIVEHGFRCLERRSEWLMTPRSEPHGETAGFVKTTL